MSDDDKKPTYQTQTTSSDPWSGQQDFLKTGFEQAQSNVLNKPISYYPESTVVQPSGQTEEALGRAENRALQGNPLVGQAQGQMGANLSGDYLSAGNPYFQGMAERAIDPMRREFQNTVMPGINSAFSKGGRYGSNAHQTMSDTAADTYLRNVGNLTAGMAGQNYAQERGNMMQSAGMAPQLAQQDYFDIGQLGNVGAAREGIAGQNLAENINRFNFEQMEPRERLGAYMGLIGGGYGGQQTTTSPIQGQGSSMWSPILGALGAASTGAGIAGSLWGQNGIWPNSTTPVR